MTELCFSRSLYDLQAVEAAAAAYAAFATLAVRLEGHDIVVSLEGLDEDLREEITDNFCNHALFTTIVSSRERDTTADDKVRSGEPDAPGGETAQDQKAGPVGEGVAGATTSEQR